MSRSPWGNTEKKRRDLRHHSKTIWVLISFFLEEHVINEEASSDQRRLASYVKVHWEPEYYICWELYWKVLIKILRDAEVVHVSEGLLQKSCPLFWNPPNLVFLVRSHHLELHVTPAGHGAPGTLDDQGYVSVAVCDLKSDESFLISQIFSFISQFNT